MQFFEKQFRPSEGFVLLPTGTENLEELIRERIDLAMSFVIYQGDDIHNLDAPIVGHAGVYAGEFLAPIVSYPDEESHQGDENGRKVYMLDTSLESPKIIQVPTGIPLVGMRDSYRYQTAMQKFYTVQTVEQILAGLRAIGYRDYVYVKENVGPMDFTAVSTLKKNLRQLVKPLPFED